MDPDAPIPMSTLRRTAPTHLAGLLRIAADDHRDWWPDDLAAMHRHMLSAPVECVLAGLRPDAASRLKMAAPVREALLMSVGDLVHHPSPPVEVLELAKQSAKVSRNCACSSLPPEIATVLYFACVAAALVRHHARITRLDDEALRMGLEWCRRQPWIDDVTQALIGDALGQVGT